MIPSLYIEDDEIECVEKGTGKVFEGYCLCTFDVIEISALLTHQDA
jgi:hypothetical protein